MEHVLVISNLVTGVVAAFLTYLAARHRTAYSERALYVGAVHDVTQELRDELRRIRQERDVLRERVAKLERELAALQHPPRLPGGAAAS